VGSPDLDRQRFNGGEPIDQEHVLFFDYAYAEMLEPGRWNPEAAQLAADVAQIGGPDRLSPEDRRNLVDRICQHREPMLGFLLRNPTKWFAGSFDVDAIGALRLTSWFEQPHFANARTIDELLESLGGATYAKLDFRLDAMRGRPIIVSANLAGPYCLIEGTTRCCEVVRLARRGEAPSATTPFVLGVCPNIHEYTPFLRGAPISGARPWWVPVIDFLKGTLLNFAGGTQEGQLVAAVGNAWRRILQFVAQYPDEVFRMKPREFEQFIAGCYDHDGYSVTLTRASGDHGIDVIAEKPGVGSIRILDQVKQYKLGSPVTAEEVRAFLWAATKRNATKCFITTTSSFAPRLLQDSTIEEEINRGFLDLRDGAKTTAWLRELEKKT
jgi:restriction system protein